MSGKPYVSWIDLSQSTNFKSQLMSYNYGKMVVSVDFFEDNVGKTRKAVTGQVEFKAQSTESEDRLSVINNGTMDASNLDYDNPYSVGPCLYLHGDFSGVSGGKYARVSIWRGV